MIINKYKKFWANSFNLKGKSRTEDFWLSYIVQNILVLISFLFALTGDFDFILMLVFILGSILAIYSLDLRRLRDIDKKWYWNKVALNVYIDIQNAYNFQGETPPSLIAITDNNGNILEDPNDPTRYQLKTISNTAGTILPSVGLQFEF